MLAREAQMKHEHAFRAGHANRKPSWTSAAAYQYRVRGEYHLLNPQTVSKLQHAVRDRTLRDVPGIHAI